MPFRAIYKRFVQSIWFLFLALMVLLPVPVAALFPVLQKAARRNPSAQTLRKE